MLDLPPMIEQPADPKPSRAETVIRFTSRYIAPLMVLGAYAAMGSCTYRAFIA